MQGGGHPNDIVGKMAVRQLGHVNLVIRLSLINFASHVVTLAVSFFAIIQPFPTGYPRDMN